MLINWKQILVCLQLKGISDDFQAFSCILGIDFQDGLQLSYDGLAFKLSFILNKSSSKCFFLIKCAAGYIGHFPYWKNLSIYKSFLKRILNILSLNVVFIIFVCLHCTLQSTYLKKCKFLNTISGQFPAAKQNKKNMAYEQNLFTNDLQHIC